NIPLSKIDYQTIERADLTRYTSIVLTGSLPFSKEFVARLTDWVERGGTLIATGTAAQWAVTNKIATGFAVDTTRARRGGDAAAQFYGGNPAERLTGAILKGELNLSHTLAYGFTSKDFYVLKTSINGLPAASSPNSVVLKTTSGEPVNGYVPATLYDKLKDLSVVAATNRGRGAVVLFGESPTFRGYYLAPGRLLTNALFFGVGTGGPREY
ncbi:MAG: hypothetical protein LBN37_08025, partial [Bacteroidales bacterium]|nr:hypothetical protein [Bacteroidales bacterium]